MKEEKSCGAVISRESGDGIEILLIRHKNGGHWSFPKGHVEDGETEEQTALREIREETGLQVRLDQAFRHTVSYSPKELVWKEVVYFAAAVLSGQEHVQPEEISDMGWFTPAQAEERITYENDQKILGEFLRFRQENPPV